jgi:type-F conjugative transfer system pilin assembly protein TrbC
LEETQLLCALSFSLLISSAYTFSKDKACAHGEGFVEQKSCKSSLLNGNSSYEGSSMEESILKLQEASIKKVEEIQADKEFQNIVVELKTKTLPHLVTFQDAEKMLYGELYIFVSFSLGEKALMNLAHDAKRYGATLVLRGFRKGSYAQTVQTLQKIILKTGQGFIIDPELYSLFSITAVPTFVLTKLSQISHEPRTLTPLHDRMQGHVSAHYALENFAKEGELQSEAKTFLKKGKAE